MGRMSDVDGGAGAGYCAILLHQTSERLPNAVRAVSKLAGFRLPSRQEQAGLVRENRIIHNRVRVGGVVDQFTAILGNGGASVPVQIAVQRPGSGLT